MKAGKIVLTLGLIIGSFASSALAELPEQVTHTLIDIAGYQVPVVKGGLYDRYRSNTPLSVVEKESPEIDLSWFRTLEKTKRDIGFETYSPNFYYKNSRVSVIYTADIDRLRELVPKKVQEYVEPLQFLPGRGVVALTAYTYHYCDNDSYNEISLSIATNKPGNFNLGPISLARRDRGRDYWGYVLKLPVDSELARVRGVVGYNLPKWLTGISYKENPKSILIEVIDQESAEVDFVLETRKLDELTNKPEMVKNSFTNVSAQGDVTTGHAVFRQLSAGSSTNSEDVKLKLTNGSFSRFIKSLQLGDMIRYDYVPHFQGALFSPEPIALMLDN